MNKHQHEQDLMSCVHCGLCLNSCPTYLETGSEPDSPRGRIVLMRGLHEGSLAKTEPDVVRHLDRCLGCRACETACPSGVPYGRLLEYAREEIAHGSSAQSPLTVAARHFLLGTLASPKKMTIAMRVARITNGTMPASIGRLLAGDDQAAPQTITLPNVDTTAALPAFTPAVGQRRFRVGMLAGCVMRVMYGDVHQDTVRVLAANGCEVLINERQGCCGALHLHNGFGDDARALARRLIDAFWPWAGLDAIIINSAGCGSTLKEYGDLFADDPEYAEKARAFASKIRDISEFLDEAGWIAPLRPLSAEPLAVAYHDACHLAHGQGIRDAPRALLSMIPGITLVPLAESEICCGSAGIYNFTEPQMAQRLQERKLSHIAASGASIVAAANPGCLAWIASGMKDRPEVNLRVVHPVTLLAEALAD